MTTAHLIFYPICIGVLFAEFSGIPKKFSYWILKKYKIGKHTIPHTHIHGYSGPILQKIPYRLKPFDCGMCLSFWIGIFQNLILHLPVYQAFGYACVSSVISYLLVKIHERINRI